MKKKIALALFCLGTAAALPAEMQLQLGPEFGFGVWENEFAVPYRFSELSFWSVYQEDVVQRFVMPGFGIAIRNFPGAPLSNQTIKAGFVFRTGMSVVTNLEEDGVSYGLDDNFSVTRAFFGGGLSSLILFSNRVHFITDFGFGVSAGDAVWTYDTSKTGELKTLEYSTLGFALFSDVAFQFNLTKRFYLELGMNALINFFSSTEGEAKINGYNKAPFDDSARFDYTGFCFYLHAGWRVQLIAPKAAEAST
jgi:hypothetical protein